MRKKKQRSCKRISKSRKKRIYQRNMRIGIVILLLLTVVAVMVKLVKSGTFSDQYTENEGDVIERYRPEIEVNLLTTNPYSRPGIETGKITGVVVHYTANPGATAMNNRDYFESLKDTHETKVSSNFVIGLEGEIVQCVPTWEVAYASNGRNNDTVSIECCHPDITGKFNDKTYESMVELCAWLCLKFDLKETDVIRHYDVTGKNCPKYFVENEGAWEQFRSDIGEELKTYK